MEKIANKDFLERIRSNKQSTGVIEVMEPVTIKSGNFGRTSEISNYHFREKVLFDGANFPSLSLISNCTFDKMLTFSNCTFTYHIWFENLSGQKIHIKGCKYPSMIIKECKFQDLNIIEDSQSSEKDTTFEGGIFSNINLGGQHFSSLLEFSKTNIERLKFVALKFSEGVEISNNCQIQNVLFDQTHFQQDVSIKDCTIENMNLMDSSFDRDFEIEPSSRLDILTIYNVILHSELYLQLDKNIQKAYFHSIKLMNSMILEPIHSEHLERASLDSIRFTGVTEGDIFLNNLSVRNLEFNEINNANILLTALKINRFELSSLSNQKLLLINHLQPEGENSSIRFFASKLGNTEILNSDLTKFQNVSFTLTNLSDITILNSSIPNEISIEEDVPEVFKDQHRVVNNRIENYRQLKQVMKKQGDISRYFHYKTLEMELQRTSKETKLESRLILFLNKCSNSYGTNWIQGICFTIGMGWLFFLLYNYSLKTPIFYIEYKNWNSFTHSFSYSTIMFLKYLGSIPKFELEFTSTGWTPLIVLLSRIFIGFGIYQTIVAFRRYGKSNS